MMKCSLVLKIKLKNLKNIASGYLIRLKILWFQMSVRWCNKGWSRTGVKHTNKFDLDLKFGQKHENEFQESSRR